MSWIEELENRVFNENTIVKPWTVGKFISLFEYLKENGIEEFTRFTKESLDLEDEEKNFLRMPEVYGWHFSASTKEKWLEILNRYPNIKKFLEENDMLDRRMLCSETYYFNLFFWVLSKNPSLTKTFLENMKTIAYLNADICWCPTGLQPFSLDSNGTFHSLAYASYDITDGNEELIFIKKYYCGVDLQYRLIHSKYTEKNGRRYRHDVFLFDYKNGNVTISQAANHGWLLQVIINRRTIKKMMVLQNFSMNNPFDDGFSKLPSLEEVEKLDLTPEMKAFTIDPELTEIYLKELESKKLLKNN